MALIAERPGVRAPDLAAFLERETLPCERDVRMLEEVGLSRSLPAGRESHPADARTRADRSGRIEA